MKSGAKTMPKIKETPAMTPTERQRLFVKRMHERGMKKVAVWIPAGDVAARKEIEATAARLAKAAEARAKKADPRQPMLPLA